MSSTASWRISASAFAAVLLAAGCASDPGQVEVAARDPTLLHSDDFRDGLGQWHIEAEKPGVIAASAGVLDIDVPAGATLWFKPKLEGPIAIEFDATAVAASGANDQVSDLNVFWMARNVDGSEPVYALVRSGKFEEYHALLTYYVGLGGNRNTTTRFRRYIGDPVLRPLRPGYDLAGDAYMLVPNKRQTIRLVANGRVIEYWRDGTRIFHLEDPDPYEKGWFAFRTTYSHLRIERFRVRRVTP
ncbi:MAG TPA: DUF6250 domain-containing protein [Steroidobacteraceae bacterium]|nr:DUF6250 domain-containing protein [Steroidobacteraceae bacterium]